VLQPRQPERHHFTPASAKSLLAAENQLLHALPSEDVWRILPGLEHVTCSLGDVFYEPGRRLDYMVFPSSCIVSLVYTMQDGSTAEMGVVGNEGAVGMALFMGGETMPHRAVAMVAGEAVRLKAKTVLEEFRRGCALQQTLLLHAQAMMTQVCQTAVCNRLHSLEQRLCRWILMCHDRLKSDQLLMTQEFIAAMLGGRRQSVTVAAGQLQDEGLIRYSRGHIDVLNRTGLEAAACECYGVVKVECDRLAALANVPR